MSELMQASRQWASRPSDERFTSLLALGAKCKYEKDRSTEKVVSSRKLSLEPVVGDYKGIRLVGPNGNPVDFTHWSFGQISTLAGAPAKYLRKLPSPIAADALNYGLQVDRSVEDVGVLLTRGENGEGVLRAATGPNYGRIWNTEIVDTMIDHFGNGVDGDFKVPGEFGKDVPITKENTTIFGSDRDIFVFLADEKNRITIPNRRNGESGSLARGFFVWNSEVGSQSIGAGFFAFDYACCNRIVWGAQGYQEIRLRHTVSAPDRWLDEITPILSEYANASAKPIEETIRNAQAKKLDKDVEEFLSKRFGFTQGQAKQIAQTHIREENKPIETIWDCVTGVTAFAKSIEHQDARVAIERQAGKILDLVAVKNETKPLNELLGSMF